MKNLKSFLIVTLLSFAMPVWASVITIGDFDEFEVDNSGDEYNFTCALSTANTRCTFGVNLDLWETMNFEFTAPSEFSLTAGAYTGQDFSGTGIALPNTFLQIGAGDTWSILAEGDVFPGSTWWFALELGPEDYLAIDTHYGGSWEISSGLTGSDNLYVEDDPGTVQVSEPKMISLLMVGMFLMAIWKLGAGKSPAYQRKIVE